VIQLYVWLVWRNAGPRIALICVALGAASVVTAVLHHIFSRSQRSAYERVVKLLGVRRLTAGFFDVSSGGQQAGGLAQLDNMRRSDGRGPMAVRDGEDEGFPGAEQIVDPAKLDPIQAALYVSKMYEKEVAALDAERDAMESDSSEEKEAEEVEVLSDEDDDNLNDQDEAGSQPEDAGNGQSPWSFGRPVSTRGIA